MKCATAGLALLVMFAAGCGGGDEESLSQPEYVKRANVICAKFNEDVAAESEKVFAGLKSEKELTPAIARDFFEATVPLFNATLEDLRELQPPEDDEETVEEIYAAGEKESDKVSAGLDSDAEVKELIAREDVTPQFEKLAGDYGMGTCAAD